MHQRHLFKRRVAFALVAFCALVAGSACAQPPSTTAIDTDADSIRPLRFDFHSVRGRQPPARRVRRYEGETDLERVGRKSRPQGLKQYGDQWSGDAHLLWDGAVGESMKTSFDVQAEGVYDLAIQLTVATDYGVFEFSMPGTDVRRTVDLYGPNVALAPRLTLKDVRLKAGKQSLTFKLIGSNPSARTFQGGYLLGLDYVQLTRKDKPPTDTGSPNPAVEQAGKTTTTNKQTPPEPFAFDALKSMMNQFCYKCHGGGTTEADVDLTAYTRRETFLTDIIATRAIRDAVARHEMPPEDEKQPTRNQRARMVAAFDAVSDEYLQQHHAWAAVVMRRLNRYEYNNAVRDLLKLRGDIYPLPEKTIRADQPYFDPASGRFPAAVLVGNRTLGKNQVERQILTGVSPFAIDLQSEGGFNNRGRQLSVSPILLESFVTLGRSIVNSPEFDDYCEITASFFKPPAGSTPDQQQQQQLAGKRLAAFLELAFRSNVEPQVVERYQGFFMRQLAETGSFQQSMKEVVAAALASPRFIYLSESAAVDESESMLSSYELATRLSFFLWSSIPDETLLAAARDGSLTQPAVLDAQVKRMLEDPRCQALSQNFARQWLRLDRLVTAVPDFDRFPQYYSRIGCEQWKFGLQMMIEPLLLFESIMVEDRSILLLVDSDYTYRSDELQSWYSDKVPFAGRDNRNRFDTNRQVYRRRDLKDRRQGGVLTSAAALTMTSAPLRTSPITRGAWVATVLFNQPPPPPPDAVPPIEADDKAIEAEGLTLRQRLQQHQANRSCVSCHAKIDPLGFALENFDAVGRWRDTYRSGLAIDASGKLFGVQPFNDAVELKDAILAYPERFMQAFCEHLLSYALGRELEPTDAPAVKQIVTQVAADRGQFTTVVREIVQSHPFRYRAQPIDTQESE